MVSSGIVYYWVYHIRNFVLRNFCHLSSSHGPGLVTRPICTSRVWSMLVTAWPWHVGTSMWLTKSAAPMVTRKCWLYLLVKRIVIGCNLQFQTSGRDLLWFEMFRRPSTLKQFCILNYISMRQINTSIYFTVSQCLSHSAALLDQDGFESKTSNTSCIMPCPPASATSCHIMPHHWGNVGGPFDQYEPMQHWTGRSLPPNVTGQILPAGHGIHKSTDWSKLQRTNGCRIGLWLGTVSQIASIMTELWNPRNYLKYFVDNSARTWPHDSFSSVCCPSFG